MRHALHLAVVLATSSVLGQPVLVKDINPGPAQASSSPAGGIAFGGQLCFGAFQPQTGFEPGATRPPRARRTW